MLSLLLSLHLSFSLSISIVRFFSPNLFNCVMLTMILNAYSSGTSHQSSIYGTQTSSVSLTWELTRNVKSQPSPHTCRIRIWGGAQQSGLQDSNACQVGEFLASVSQLQPSGERLTIGNPMVNIFSKGVWAHMVWGPPLH